MSFVHVSGMKRLIVLTGVCGVSFFGGVFVQAEEATKKSEQPVEKRDLANKDEKKIVEIRQLARKIDADTSLKKVVLKAGLDPSFDPILTRFEDSKGVVKKLDIVVKGDHGVTREIYYFDKGILFFIKADDEFWVFKDPKKSEGKKTDAPTENVLTRLRYYYDGNRCIRVAEKEVEKEDPREARDSFKHLKNQTLEIGATATSYQEKASLIRQIKTQADLKFYLEKRFQGK